jgi:hypothetical protein
LERGQESLGKGLEAVARSVDNLVMNFGKFSESYAKNTEPNHEKPIGHNAP